MADAGHVAEALAKADPEDITRRLLEHENTEKLLECLYEKITSEVD
jgi:hypothetical protein